MTLQVSAYVFAGYVIKAHCLQCLMFSCVGANESLRCGARPHVFRLCDGFTLWNYCMLFTRTSPVASSLNPDFPRRPKPGFDRAVQIPRMILGSFGTSPVYVADGYVRERHFGR